MFLELNLFQELLVCQPSLKLGTAHTYAYVWVVPGLLVVSMESSHCKLDSVSNAGTTALRRVGFGGDRIHAVFFMRSIDASRAASWHSGKLGGQSVQSSKKDLNFSWRESKSTWGQGMSSSLMKNDSEFFYLQSSLYYQLCPYIIKVV